jgi:DNA replication protein DnaC
MTATNLNFREWSSVFSNAMMTTGKLDRLTHRCHSLTPGNDNSRFKASSATAAQTRSASNRSLTQA